MFSQLENVTACCVRPGAAPVADAVLVPGSVPLCPVPRTV
jgi:hypothetical protein